MKYRFVRFKAEVIVRVPHETAGFPDQVAEHFRAQVKGQFTNPDAMDVYEIQPGKARTVNLASQL